MDNQRFVELCKKLVVKSFNERADKTDNFNIDENEVYVVWLSKTLQNNKALLSTTVPDGKYYEVTYNGDKCEFYLDVYVKLVNVCVAREDI